VSVTFLFSELIPKVLTSPAKGHFAPIFGSVCAILGITYSHAERMFLRCYLRDLSSAASRLNVIGPLVATRIQVDLVPFIEAALKERDQSDSVLEISSEDLDLESLPTQSAPILDFIQGRHDSLYTRLFNS